MIDKQPKHKLPSFRRAMIFFAIATVLGVISVVIMLGAALWGLMMLPGVELGDPSRFGLSHDIIKDYGEALTAPIALILGVSVSVSGAFSAIYIASVASEVQRQQYELELRAVMDAEFTTTKAIFSQLKKSLVKINEFLLKRDLIIFGAIERANEKGASITVHEIVSIASERNLDLEHINVLSSFSDCMLELEQNKLASELRANTFITEKSFCDAAYSDELRKIIDRLETRFTHDNMAYGNEIMQYSGALEPEVLLRTELESKMTEVGKSDYLALFSETKAVVNPVSVVHSFIHGYEVAMQAKGEVVYQANDFGQRDKKNGLAALLGTNTYDALKIDGKGSRDSYATLVATQWKVSIVSGAVDLLRLLLSVPSLDRHRKIIDETCRQYITNQMPAGSTINKATEQFLDREIDQLATVCRDIFGTQEYVEGFSLPCRIYEDYEFDRYSKSAPSQKRVEITDIREFNR